MRRFLWVVLVWACGGKSPLLPDEPPVRSGSWYATDLHVHSSVGSNDTDGESSVDAHAQVARERGLSLIAITDHSNSAGSMDCETGDVEDCPNQGPEFPARADADAASDEALAVVVGVEISPVESLDTTLVPTGHVGCLPRQVDSFRNVTEAVVDRPAGSVAGGDGVVWCQGQGGIAVINHPYAPTAWVSYDWTNMEYDAVEVFNGSARFDMGDARAVDAWACDVARGKGTAPVGGSDTHRATTESPPPGLLDQSLGFPTTWVWSESADVDGVLAGLEAGRTVVADPRTELEMVGWNERDVAGPGEVLKLTGTGAIVRVSAEVEHTGLRLQVVDLREGACTDDTRSSNGESPTLKPEVLHQVVLVPETPVQVDIEIEPGESRRLVAWILPTAESYLAHDGVAVSAPIEIVAQ
jgi:hypothetical protein